MADTTKYIPLTLAKCQRIEVLRVDNGYIVNLEAGSDQAVAICHDIDDLITIIRANLSEANLYG